MTQGPPPAYLWTPPAVRSLPVKGRAERAPVNRLFFVGRNYHAHAREMGASVDKASGRPFYFTKSPQALVESGAKIAYPPQTKDFHHEMELVVVLGAPGFEVPTERAGELVFGYACGLDMTRRDLQRAAREKGLPWDFAKDAENSAIVSEIVPLPGALIDRGEIALSVSGETRQRSDIGQMIWSVAELLADLSTFYHLAPGDLVFTGTPEGVGPVKPGDVLEGHIAGVGSIAVRIASAAPDR